MGSRKAHYREEKVWGWDKAYQDKFKTHTCTTRPIEYKTSLFKHNELPLLPAHCALCHFPLNMQHFLRVRFLHTPAMFKHGTIC